MSQTESASSGYKLTGGVAATINGTNLTDGADGLAIFNALKRFNPKELQDMNVDRHAEVPA